MTGFVDKCMHDRIDWLGLIVHSFIGRLNE